MVLWQAQSLVAIVSGSPRCAPHVSFSFLHQSFAACASVPPPILFARDGPKVRFGLHWFVLSICTDYFCRTCVDVQSFGQLHLHVGARPGGFVVLPPIEIVLVIIVVWWWLCVCVCVCMCACLHVCVRMCVCACLSVSTAACICVCVSVCASLHACVCMCVSVCLRVRTHTLPSKSNCASAKCLSWEKHWMNLDKNFHHN